MQLNLFNKKRSMKRQIVYAIGGAALIGVMAGLIAFYPDMRRYMKIKSM